MEIKLQEQQTAQSPQGEPAASDIKKAAAEAEIRVRAQAEGKFLEETTEKSRQDSDQKAEESSKDEEEGRSGRDTAALSNEGRYYKLSPEELSDLDKMWGREKADLAWSDLLNWAVSPLEPVSDQLSRLAGIYEKLLAAILSNTTGAVKEQQLSELERILSDILLETLHTRLGQLDSLFQKYGTKDSGAALRAALYRSVTGASLSERELERFFAREEGTAESRPLKEAPAGNPTENIRLPVSDGEEGLEQGIIYERAGEGRIKNSSQYARRMQEDAGISVWGRKNGSKAGTRVGEWGAKAVISPKEQNSIYTLRDLELAEDFAQYMTRKGNLFLISELSGNSEELYGFLAAIMAIKSNTFSAFSGVDKGLAFELRGAVDRMIDFYIQRAWKQSESGGRNTPSFEPKEAYKIYYYIMNQYQTTRNLQEAANKGIRQAYRQFLKKKECQSREEDRGAFFTKNRGDMTRDWKEGKQILEKDWKEFLTFLGQGDLGNIPAGVLSLSPWGMFAEPERVQTDRSLSGSVPVWGVLAGVLFLLFWFFGL